MRVFSARPIRENAGSIQQTDNTMNGCNTLYMGQDTKERMESGDDNSTS